MHFENPFLEVYRSAQYSRPYERGLPNFPILIDLEATNCCNLDCIMCSRQIMKRKTGKMPFSLFKKIADEAAVEGSRGIRFIRFGEPLLNEKVFEMVSYARKKGLLTHLTTNGLVLDDEGVEAIFDSGLDSIIFSFQGPTKEEYELMRNSNCYGMLLDNIKGLVGERRKRNSGKPFVQVTTTVLDESDEQIKSFYEKWQGIVDRVDHWYTSLERLEGIKRAEPLFERQKIREMLAKQEKNTGRNWRCNEVMVKLSINWDGEVTACCGDFDNYMKVGDLEKSSLKEIWTCEKMNSFREILRKGERNKIPFCSKCTSKF